VLTYNFDPERWFDRECAVLEKALREGILDRAAYEAARDGLQQKLDALWDRLDGSYRLPE
jgi:pyrroloquinoline quinone (PQQ) biosynthesis protein C